MNAKREWFTPHDFVMVHVDLIRLGLSLEAVVLLSRIEYKAHDDWWTATKATLGEETGLSEWKVTRALTELRDRGLIESERADRMGASTLRWRIAYEDDETSRSGMRFSHAPEGEDSSSSSYKKKENPPTPLRFDEWWSMYPKKTGKGAARTAYAKALTKVTEQELMNAINAQRAGLVAAHERGFCPNPTTWLNQERWSDEIQLTESLTEWEHMERIERSQR